MKLKAALLLSTLALLLVPAIQAQDYTPKSLSLLVYNDGVVQVDYEAETDPSLVRIEVELPGFPYESLLVVDQDGLPLDASVTDEGASVDTLGSTGVVVTYLTSSLTSKAGAIWTVNVTSTTTASVALPQGSIIVNLSEVPVEIGTNDDRPYVRMLPGDISVSYITSVFDARAKAEEALADAEQQIQAITDGGIIVEALDLLQQASEAFDLGDYTTAIQLAAQAEDAADEAAADASQAQDMMEAAGLAVSEAESEGRTKGVDVAEQLLAQAAAAYETGDYESAYDHAYQSQIAALNAEKPQSLTVYVLVAVILIIGAALYNRLSKKPGKPPAPKHMKVDLEAIFHDHPTLRMDDREVIRYIAESGGELFSNEIRERFDLPRTSAWRMLRRLEGLEIIEERKVGGQSLVNINRRYQR